MMAPEFWNRDSALSKALYPASLVFSLLGRIERELGAPYKAGVPVICVGNLALGGAGKTPVAIAIAKSLQMQGKKPAFLTRGYGGHIAKATRVDPSRHDFLDVGDEALLLAETAPTWVAKRRSEGAGAVSGADVIIMDDGFQNPFVFKDYSYLVIDSEGLGNRKIFPAGPLRESFGSGLERADEVILLGGGRVPELESVEGPVTKAGMKIFVPEELRGKKLLAVAGIGRPEKFFASLRAEGCEVISRSFPDHHKFSRAELDSIKEQAKREGAEVVTTAKDAVRLKNAPFEYHVIRAEIVFEGDKEFKIPG